MFTFFMTHGHFTMNQIYGLKINDHYFSLRHIEQKLIITALLNADKFSDQGHIPGIQDKGYSFSLKE